MLKHGEWCWLDDGKGNRVRLIANAEQPKGKVTCAHGTHAIQDATTCPDCLGKITHPQWLADRDTLVGLSARIGLLQKAINRATFVAKDITNHVWTTSYEHSDELAKGAEMAAEAILKALKVHA